LVALVVALKSEGYHELFQHIRNIHPELGV
jgi:hypothetical protein